jgi:hypothetical protein
VDAQRHCRIDDTRHGQQCDQILHVLHGFHFTLGIAGRHSELLVKLTGLDGVISENSF